MFNELSDDMQHIDTLNLRLDYLTKIIQCISKKANKTKPLFLIRVYFHGVDDGIRTHAPRATIWCSNQLVYIHHVMVRPRTRTPAHGLEVRCSFHRATGAYTFERETGFEPATPAGRLVL